MKMFKFAYKYILNNKISFSLFVVLSFFTWSGSIILPYLTGKYVDVLTVGKSSEGIYFFTKTLLIIVVLNIVMVYFKNNIIARLTNRATYLLNLDILEHIKRLPLTFFNNISTVYLNERVSEDSSVIVSFLMDNIIKIIVNLLTLLGITVFIFSVNIKVGLLLILLIPVYVFIHLFFRKPLYNANYDYREKQNLFFSKTNEQLNKIKLIKINSWFDVLRTELNNHFNSMYKSCIHYANISNLFTASGSVISYLARIILFFFGGMEVVGGKMSVGEFTTINVYFYMLLDCTMYFVNLGKSYQGAYVSHIRIQEILSIEKEYNGTESIEEINDIELKNISFSYNQHKEIISNFNYRFEKGNIYCIIGKNGTGKSTLIDVITGLHQNYTGEVLYNTRNARNLDLYKIRRTIIGVTEQEPSLIGNTINENLSYGTDKENGAEILKWCSDLHLSNFIENLPDRLNSGISEKASNLSGGEKQKMSLIRTFIKDPDLLILDEPTSAMDTTSIDSLKRKLTEIKKNKIVIIITHNENILDIADFTLNLHQTTAVFKCAN